MPGVYSDLGHFENRTKIFYCPTSSGASERWSEAERASEASSMEQANERAAGANERVDEQVALYQLSRFQEKITEEQAR